MHRVTTPIRPKIPNTKEYTRALYDDPHKLEAFEVDVPEDASRYHYGSALLEEGTRAEVRSVAMGLELTAWLEGGRHGGSTEVCATAL